jgi:antibiotic biosynthesis monooxygenase (ABM) superfamily enzyme
MPFCHSHSRTKESTMPIATPTPQPDQPIAEGPRAPSPVGPPSKHQLALMIWLAVFPTLTVLNLTIGPWLTDVGPVLRTLVLATVAVPIVIYGIMPRLHRVRSRLLTARAA